MYTHHPHISPQTVWIEFEGKPVEVPCGISVAAAVLGHTQSHSCRSSTFSSEKRAPYCLIGVCHECLMEIDGKPYQQACMITVREGMKIKKQTLTGGK